MRVVFIGAGDIGLPVLRWLMRSDAHELVGIVTQPDRPVGRDQRSQAPPIKAAVAGLGIPVFQPERIKNEEAISEIQALAPDVIVVMAYGQILPRAVLEIPRLACLNLHATLLPRHRGAAPIQAAIAAGDRESGITVMYMNEGLDTGDILLETPIPIAHDETGDSLQDRLALIAPRALEEALDLLSSGEAPRVQQDDTRATCAPKLERDHGLISWRESAEVIERKIRAFNPWPGAYTMLRDSTGRKRKLKIFRARLALGREAAAGALLVSHHGELLVGTGDGALLLTDLQLEGKKRMPAGDLLRGNTWLPNAIVGGSDK
ncbi:MAG: methionyl-tRNA formyltransferase [Chthoniobacterales bacterium]|nr:methionyl-tRNA formyltransferase [Chthoniobacterales bacterium]